MFESEPHTIQNINQSTLSDSLFCLYLFSPLALKSMMSLVMMTQGTILSYLCWKIHSWLDESFPESFTKQFILYCEHSFYNSVTLAQSISIISNLILGNICFFICKSQPQHLTDKMSYMKQNTKIAFKVYLQTVKLSGAIAIFSAHSKQFSWNFMHCARLNV